MTKRGQDIKVWAGDAAEITVPVTGSDGSGYDMSSASSVTYMMEESPGSGSLLRKETGGSGITISTSTATITINSGDTTSLAGTYYHEMQVVDVVGRVSTAFVGNVKIEKQGIT